RAKAALAMHHEIIDAVNANLKDATYMQDRYRVFPIAGITQDTLQSARLVGGKVELTPTYEGKDMSGDGTVPRVSAIPHEYSDASNGSFVAMKHGSLQNTESVLQHLEGVITSLDLDLGKFLAPDRRSQLSLSLEDAYFDDEPMLIEVNAGDEDRLELSAK